MGNSQQSPLQAFKDYRLASSSRGNITTTVTASSSSSRTLTYAFASQGKSSGSKASSSKNQDSVLLRPRFLGRPDLALFGVFDGHGKEGARLSVLVRDHVEAALGQELTRLLQDKGDGLLPVAELCAEDDEAQAEKIANALTAAFLKANELVESHDSTVDESYSGACALVLLFVGQRVFCANAGTSRAILARAAAPVGSSEAPQAASLSSVHSPARPDERARVVAHGARVLSSSQMERIQAGLKVGDKAAGTSAVQEDEEEASDPLRVWDGQQAKPGCLFTRSIGDSYAKRLGVCAEPEVCIHKLDSTQDRLICLATHGVFEAHAEEEGLTGPDLVAMVDACDKPMDACKAVGDYHNQRRKADGGSGSDTTLLCIFLKDVAAASDVTSASEHDTIITTTGEEDGDDKTGDRTVLVAKAT